jgi:hypothetical protein
MTGFLAPQIVAMTLLAVFSCGVSEFVAQNPVNPDSSRTGVVLTKLSAPVYRSAARAAHIIGDVDLMLSV